ncbi:MAG: FHA domain-containing protein [Synechococcales bacterium]|nr:FHA domain-containing protein [Synechococcales bacterium]
MAIGNSAQLLNSILSRVIRVIILTLLHPIKQSPVQTWTFSSESVIRIGRSTDNNVVLYSAVVSRHHVELRRVGSSWEVVNLGTNGTYLEGKRITQMPITDGAVIRLARSGPNIQIRIGESALKELSENLANERPASHRKDTPFIPTEITSHNTDFSEAIVPSVAENPPD